MTACRLACSCFPTAGRRIRSPEPIARHSATWACRSCRAGGDRRVSGDVAVQDIDAPETLCRYARAHSGDAAQPRFRWPADRDQGPFGCRRPEAEPLVTLPLSCRRRTSPRPGRRVRQGQRAAHREVVRCPTRLSAPIIVPFEITRRDRSCVSSIWKGPWARIRSIFRNAAAGRSHIKCVSLYVDDQ